MPSTVQPGRSARSLRQKGTVLWIFTFACTFILIPMAGLAIDIGIVFWAKAKLSAAVDASALAAGRSLNIYNSSNQNSGTASTIAQQWFWANFPKGWLGTSVVGGAPTINYVTTSSSTQQVTVVASALVPLYFARMMGFNQMTISAQAQSSRRNTFVVLVLDRSGSMNLNNSGINACTTMQADSINFSNMFTENFDTMSLITFSTTANYNQFSSTPIDYGPKTVFKTGMKNTINSLQCQGGTGTAQALWTAYQTILNNGGLRSGLNAIVLFTDGQPNTIVGDFPVMNTLSLGGTGKTDSRYGSFPSGYTGYNNYNTLYNAGPSGCPATLLKITGGLYSSPVPDPFSSSTIQPATLGMTFGFYDPFTWVSTSSSANFLSGSAYNGCYFTNSNSGHAPDYETRLDIAYLPATDHFGNNLSTGYAGLSGYYGAGGAAAPQTFPSGMFKNLLRPDMEQGSVTPAAINAADYMAARIRNDANYNIVIYTIGLGGAPDYPIDSTLLERMANDPRSPIYDRTKSQGFFAYASDPSQLNQAFTQVAGQILQLTQ